MHKQIVDLTNGTVSFTTEKELAAESDYDKLGRLLEARSEYLAFGPVKRKIFALELEKTHKAIIKLKLKLDLYADEEDILRVIIDYDDPQRKKKFAILENAEIIREVRWMKKIYTPAKKKAEYVGLVEDKRFILDLWIRGVYKEHLSKISKQTLAAD